ncbi:MAG: hypothetical protein VX185_03520 [Pseudomonadota bacterium]|nr:hypothetical protein [Pseudomonadota bacterium]
MKSSEFLVVECRHEVYGVCLSLGSFLIRGVSTIKIKPYKYSETELYVKFAKDGLDAFYELNAKNNNYTGIQELNVKIVGVQRIKENGVRTDKVQSHLKKVPDTV